MTRPLASTAGTQWPFAPDADMWSREEARHAQHRAAVCALTRYARAASRLSDRRQEREDEREFLLREAEREDRRDLAEQHAVDRYLDDCRGAND